MVFVLVDLVCYGFKEFGVSCCEIPGARRLFILCLEVTGVQLEGIFARKSCSVYKIELCPLHIFSEYMNDQRAVATFSKNDV